MPTYLYLRLPASQLCQYQDTTDHRRALSGPSTSNIARRPGLVQKPQPFFIKSFIPGCCLTLFPLPALRILLLRSTELSRNRADIVTPFRSVLHRRCTPSASLRTATCSRVPESLPAMSSYQGYGRPQYGAPPMQQQQPYQGGSYGYASFSLVFCPSRTALCLVWLTGNAAASSRRLVLLRNIHLSRTRIRAIRRRSMSTTNRDNHSSNRLPIPYEALPSECALAMADCPSTDKPRSLTAPARTG